jgi:hypothetical protein
MPCSFPYAVLLTDVAWRPEVAGKHTLPPGDGVRAEVTPLAAPEHRAMRCQHA